MQIDMTNEERDILIRWKKRTDTHKLVRMKAEAIVYAARGVGLDIIAEEELEEVLSRPPSESGVKAAFWDVPALRDVVQTGFGVEYRSDSS